MDQMWNHGCSDNTVFFFFDYQIKTGMPITAQNSDTENTRRSRRPDSQKPLVSQWCKYRGQIHTKASLRGNFHPFLLLLPAPGSHKVAYPILPAMVFGYTSVACSGDAGLLVYLVVLPQKCLEAELVESTGHSWHRATLCNTYCK